MDPHSQTDDTPHSRHILEGQLRRAMDASFTPTRRTRNAPTFFSQTCLVLGSHRSFCPHLRQSGFVGVVFGTGKIGAVCGLVISTALLAINSYTKNYDLGELAQKHKQAANDLWVIRERYMSLLVDIAMRERPLEALQNHRDELVEQLHTVYSGAPSTTFRAYKKAQIALKELEDMTFSDEEIDAFLPKELKRRQS